MVSRKKMPLDTDFIVFTSDNGAAVGPASSWSESLYRDAKDNSEYGGDRIEVGIEGHGREHRNAQGVASDGSPLRGEKGFVYEGGHRVPLVMCWSQKIPGGRRIRDQIIGLHDLFRTLCGLASISVPADQANDSYDFTEVLTANGIKAPLVRESLYIQSNRPWEQNIKKSFNTWAAYGVTTENNSTNIWKAVLEYNTKNFDGMSNAKCVELFHLISDPSESQDLSADVVRRVALEAKFHDMASGERTVNEE